MKSLRYRLIKRSFDVVVSTVLLVALSPVLLTIAAVIRICMGSPVLFRQTRTTQNGELFELVKFRTMRHPDPDGTRDDAARITRLGSWLRDTSLDELPELLHVLSGRMSLVGPRPLLPQYLDRYSARQARRHEVPGGLTGWAQVHGRNATSWEERFEQDVWYVENASLRLDLEILARTVGRVLKREGISAEHHVTMPEFLGTGPADTSVEENGSRAAEASRATEGG